MTRSMEQLQGATITDEGVMTFTFTTPILLRGSSPPPRIPGVGGTQINTW
jgi:hypothetical protein